MMKTRKFSLRLPKGRDIGLQVAMILLMLIGLIMGASAAMTSNVILFDLLVSLIKQSLFLLIGYLAYVWLSKHFSLAFIKRHYLGFIILSFVGAVLPLIFPEINGAKAWIPISLSFTQVSIQPSEFLKIMTILILAVYLGEVTASNVSFGQLIKMPLFYIGGLLFIIILLQHDLGSAIVLLGISVLVFMLSSAPVLRPYQWVALFGMIGVLVLAGLLLTEGGLALVRSFGLPDYMVKRFENTVNPFLNRYGTGYQLISSLMAFVKGDWFGVGFGKSLQKYGYLPAAQTDFILAVIAEEIGFSGVVVVIILSLYLVFTLLRYASKAESDASKMILAGIAYYILLHFILNIGGVTGFIPLTGVPLLLISSGGSSALSVLMALGIAQRLISLQRNEIKS